MYRKLMLATALVAAFALPAAAATKYYVGQVVKTNKCEVTSTKPDGVKIKMIGTAMYSSKAKAETALKAAAACKA